MAKFTDYTEKTEPVDTDLALIYDTPAKVNKKFTFGNLWKWIAKKIVSEGISQLETTNKTIPGAINELNSKSLRIVNTNVLDWNAIVEIGIYSGNNAQNAPINNNDRWINAIVLASNGNPNFLSLFAFSTSKMFLRQMDNTIWNEWVQIK
jgi:hypothetical protein